MGGGTPSAQSATRSLPTWARRRLQGKTHAPALHALRSIAQSPSCRRAVDTREFADVLSEAGYTKLLIQKGAGSYVPHQLLRGRPGDTSATLDNGLHVE